MLNQISEAVVGIKNESEEKLGRLPLLEKKMNKWIKIFENSEKESINKGTEQAKKQNEFHITLNRLDNLSAKNHKMINSLESRIE